MKKVAENSGEGAAFVAGGAAGGGATSATVGGMGLAGGFGAVGIGTATVVGAGAVAGAAAYGASKAIREGDVAALGSMGIGAAGGAGVSSCVGGMGLVAPKIGLAVGIGTAPIAAVGAVVGLAAYGIAKLLDESGSGEPAAQVFERMEEKVSSQDAYLQAMMELDPGLAELDWSQKFAALEIEEELQALKAQLGTKIDLKLKPASSSLNPTSTSFVPVEPVCIPPLENQCVALAIEAAFLKTQPPET